MGHENLTDSLFDDHYRGEIDPFAVFEAWLDDAAENEPNDPNAMALATVDANGLPDVRMVLLNGRDAHSFVFFTNGESAKGNQLAANPRAALLFHWKSMRRQVRIRGQVEQVSSRMADTYFASRPRGSRIGAHASAQSRPLASRAELVSRTETLADKFAEKEVPRPDYWIGYRLTPSTIEFWQDGEFRLHDRVTFEKQGDMWKRQRLNP